MWPFKTCCLCCKLETGAYLVACFGIIFSALVIIGGSLGLSGAVKKPDYVTDNDFILALLWGTISFLTCGMLLIGAKLKERSYLMPYLCLTTVLIIVHTIVEIVDIVNHNKAGKPITFKIMIFIIGLMLPFYIWLCMASLYLKFKKGSNESGGA